jgi:predicted tellurium resistance membrane protein TerC
MADAKALEFITGYLVEKALAVDNIFVFLMLFTYFAVPAEFQTDTYKSRPNLKDLQDLLAGLK